MIRYPRAVPPVLAALIVTVGPAFGGAQIASLPPVDEASRDSSLLSFRGDVLGEGVSVRQSPGSQRPVVAILTYGIVTLPKGWTGHPDQDGSSDVVWLQVGLGDGKVGYVAEPYLRSPLGLRVTFRKRNGHWV